MFDGIAAILALLTSIKKLTALALLLTTILSIELSFLEDQQRFVQTGQSMHTWDEHPCHPIDTSGKEHRHNCHLGHCAITCLNLSTLGFVLRESRDFLKTSYKSSLKPIPDLMSLLRPPIYL